MRVLQIHISPGHNYFGHHGRPPGDHPTLMVHEAELRAGRGIVGDRFFNHRKDHAAQITFFAWEVYEDLCRTLDVRDRSPGVFRRNVITAGDDLNRYVGREFDLQGIRFEGVAECAPCYWMDRAFAPGAEDLMKGRGGLRARILGDGVLRAHEHADGRFGG
jgi:MOSC domain-containing protein YiiM